MKILLCRHTVHARCRFLLDMPEGFPKELLVYQMRQCRELHLRILDSLFRYPIQFR